jgi:hypothetical protein
MHLSSAVVLWQAAVLGSMPQLKTISLVAMQKFGMNDLHNQITIKK